MHRSFFATKDAFINSGSNEIDGTSFQDKNTGQDEVLELKKYYFNRELQGFTRALIQFNIDEIKNYITASNVPSNYKLFLRMYEADGTSGLSQNYTIAANALTESWDEGVGKEADTPKTTDGCSWLYRKNNPNSKEIAWSPQFPEGESVDGAFATASIDLSYRTTDSAWPVSDDGSGTVSQFFIKNADPTFPEIEEFKFSVLMQQGFSELARTYQGNGSYIIGGSGSLDDVGSRLRDTINLFQLNGGQGIAETFTVNEKQGSGVTTRYHTSTIPDGGAIIPYSASWDGTSLQLTASRSGVTYNNVIISTGSDASSVTSSDTPFGGGFGEVVSGYGGNYARTPQSTQIFSSQSPDIELDVTEITNRWFSGEVINNGFLLRISSSSDYDVTVDGDYELYSGSFEDIKFFSRQTNTIYSPKLELRWDDHLPATGSNTGSLTPLDLSGNTENYIYQLHAREAYKENETVKFRFGARKRYIDKSFSTSVQNVSGSYFAEGSASYSIIDMATNESVVPFSSYTTMSCDTTSPYFKQDLNSFEPNRAYKIMIKVNHNDNQTIIYDDDFEFILRV